MMKSKALFVSGFLISLSCMLSCSAGAKSEKANVARLNEKSDGGPGMYATAAQESAGEMVSGNLEREFPIAQSTSIYVLGGGVRGFGMLAEYPTVGEKRFLVARKTSAGEGEPYTPVALARVFDPDGNLAAIEDFTEQGENPTIRILKVPNGKAGIWRISFSGGRKGDLVEIRIPQTTVWGVRGEMALTISKTTPKPAYVWIPPTSIRLRIGVESGSSSGLVFKSGDVTLAEGNETSKSLLIDPVRKGSVCKLEMPANYSGSVDFEGVPGLLCPSEEAAKRLRGGTVDCEGQPVAGPLQARARKWMLAHANVPRELKFNWPKEVPANIESPELEAMPYGKYGGLNGINNFIKEQNSTLDPKNPYFGVPLPVGYKLEDEKNGSWQNFMPHQGRYVSLHDACDLAVLYSYKSQLNPLYKNENILTRAILAGFFHIASLQGDDLIRDSSLFNAPYPLTHTFFIYDGLAAAYLNLKDSLPADVKEIWMQAIMAIGDKVSDHQAYQSNQWSHMIKAHLDVYLATGEKRFLRNYEDQVKSYITGAYGQDSKFGLHPTGFFLEEFGPDGNYERLNLYALMAGYNEYKKLPEAKPELVARLKDGIEKNLQFKSFFWLPQPNGVLHSPTALNCRTGGMMCYSGFPGEYLACKEFPVASARYALEREPVSGIGMAGTTTFMANTKEWILKTLRQCVEWGPDHFPAGAMGDWVRNIGEVYKEKKGVPPAILPFQEKRKVWSLPGFSAWKQGAVYGNVFYEVDGVKRQLAGITGGGPTVLWSEELGSFLVSMQPTSATGHLASEARNVKSPEQLTYSCIFGLDDKGAFFSSGHERAEFKKMESAESFEIVSKMASPVIAAYHWGYKIQDSGLDLTVKVRALGGIKETFLNLPIRSIDGKTSAKLESPSKLVISSGNSTAIFQWPEKAAGKLEGSCLGDIKRLVIPLTGEPLTVSIRIAPAPGSLSPTSN